VTAVTTSASTINQFQSITFIATVTPGQSGGPAMTGNVRFTSSGTVTTLCSATIANGQAQCVTTSLPSGQQTIVATYAGDTNYETSFGAVNVTVNPGPDFSIVANPASITIAKPGQPGSTSLTLSSMNGLTGTFNLAPQCAGLPSESTCSVSPTSITFSSTMTTASVMLTISTTAPSNIAPNRRPHFPGAGIGMDAATAISLLTLSSLLGLLRKRRKFEFVLSAIVFAALLTFAACGGGGGGGGVHDPGTPVGLDPNASVSLTLGLATHSLPFSVNVQ
jgi:Bacterial Ig-like domain (group 3)